MTRIIATALVALLMFSSRSVLCADFNGKNPEGIAARVSSSEVRATNGISSYIVVISQGKPTEYGELAKNLASQRLFDQEILDAAARRIWLDRDLDADEAKDSIGLLIQYIGASGNPRYRDILSRIKSASPEPSTKRFARDAIKNIPESDTDQFAISKEKVVPEKKTLFERDIPDLEKYASCVNAMLVGRPRDYRGAVRFLYENDVFDREILEIAAGRLWLDGGISDKHELDGIAWLVRFIGASENSRYRDVLNRVRSRSIDQKIKRYAKEAVEGLGQAEVDQYAFDSVRFAEVKKAREITGAAYGTPQLAIATGSPDQYRLAARALYKSREFDQETLDLAATRLKLDSHLAGDGVAWLIRYIGASGNSRYRDLIRNIQALSKDHKIKKHARRALVQLPEKSVEQFPLN